LVYIFKNGMFQVLDGIISNAKRENAPFFVKRGDHETWISEKAIGGPEGWYGTVKEELEENDKIQLIGEEDAQVYFQSEEPVGMMVAEGRGNATLLIENTRIGRVTARARDASVVSLDGCTIENLIAVCYGGGTVEDGHAVVTRKMSLRRP